MSTTTHLVVAIFCVAWKMMTALRVAAALQKRGEKTNFLFLRLMAPIYAHRLAKLKEAETGGSGCLCYQWILSINLALVLVLIALVIHLI